MAGGGTHATLGVDVGLKVGVLLSIVKILHWLEVDLQVMGRAAVLAEIVGGHSKSTTIIVHVSSLSEDEEGSEDEKNRSKASHGLVQWTESSSCPSRHKMSAFPSCTMSQTSFHFSTAPIQTLNK